MEWSISSLSAGVLNVKFGQEIERKLEQIIIANDQGDQVNANKLLIHLYNMNTVQ